jgi:hypothetical protein
MLALALVAAARLPVILGPMLAALATAATAPYLPAVSATTPKLVSGDDLPGANAARSAVTALGIIAGPAIGGVLLLLGSPAIAFVVNSATFGVSALAVLAIRAAVGAFRTGNRSPKTEITETENRAYGLAILAAVAGIAIGAIAAPVVASAFGGAGALVACGGLVMGYAAALLLAPTAATGATTAEDQAAATAVPPASLATAAH